MKTTIQLVRIGSEKVKGSDCYPAVDYDFYRIGGEDTFGANADYLVEIATQAEADKIVAGIEANGLVIDATPETWDVRIAYGTLAWLEQGMEATLMDDEERFHKGI
jgi:hypothetical protein